MSAIHVWIALTMVLTGSLSGDKEPVKTILNCPVEETTLNDPEAIGPVCNRPDIGLHNGQIPIGNESERDSEDELGSRTSPESKKNPIGLDRQEWPGLSTQCRDTRRPA